MNQEEIKQYIKNYWMGLGDTSLIHLGKTFELTREELEDPTLAVLRKMRNPDYFYFTCKHLLNIELPPFQLAILKELWVRPFPMLIGARGLGKSFILALYSVLRAILEPGTKVVICGAGFRQSKLVLQYCDKIWRESPILQDLLGWDKGQGLKSPADMIVLTIGESTITGLPLGMDGSKIRGLRACVGKNTLVQTNCGLIRIKETFEKDKSLEVLTHSNKFERPEFFLQTNPITTYKVDLMGGFSFECSEIHRVMTDKGWKYAKDLDKKDKVKFLCNDYFPDDIKSHDGLQIGESEAYCLGYLISKACFNNKYKIYISDVNKENIELINDVFSLDNNIESYEGKESNFSYSSYYKFGISYRNMGRVLREICLFDGEVSVPSLILQSPKNIVISFLKGLLSNSCSILYKDKIRNNNLGISCHFKNEQITKDVQVLLTKFNIFSSRTRRLRKGMEENNLRFYGKSSHLLNSLLGIKNWQDDYIACDKNVKFIKDKEFLKVTNVEKLEEKQILYDYTIKNDESFVGGAIVHHNTNLIVDEFSCVAPNTIVETDKGLMRILDSFEYSDFKVLTGDGDNLEYPAKYVRTPKIDAYEVMTMGGYSFICSSIHKVYTNNGWKICKDLTNDDYLIFDNKYKFPNDYVSVDGKTLDENLAFLFGSFVSEGTLTCKNYINFPNTDVDFIDDVKYAINKFDNSLSENVHIYERDEYVDKRGWNCKKSYSMNICNTKFRELLFDFGLDYTTSHGKKIPWSILKSPKSVVLSFLSGLFNGDGSPFIYKEDDKEDDKDKLGIAYYSVSRQLCQDVQIILAKLDIFSTIQSRKSKISDNLQWMVRLNGQNVNKFNELVSIKRFSKCFRDLKNDALLNDIKLLKVKSVKKTEDMVLYDYRIPNDESFMGNCFRQHNSVNPEIYEVVLGGFASVSKNPIDNLKKMAEIKARKELGLHIPSDSDSLSCNQSIISGTADYSFRHFGEYWRKYSKIVKSMGDIEKLQEIFGDEACNVNWKDYSVIRIPVELIPEGYMDEKNVTRMRLSLNTTNYLTEFSGCFPNDSIGFFKRSLIESCVASQTKPVNGITFQPSVKGNKSKKHVIGVDPASEKDNFAIVVIEMNPDHNRIVHVWTTKRSLYKQREKSGLAEDGNFNAFCARKIRDLMKAYPCERIAMDAQGGGYGIEEALQDSDKLQPGELRILPIIEDDKEKPTDNEQGLHILEMIQFSNADWVAHANHGLKKDMEDKTILFPDYDAALITIAQFEDSTQNRLYDTLEDCIFEIEELKNELCTIVHEKTPSGRDKWDTPETKLNNNKKGRLHKDRYSALLMANMSSRTIFRTPLEPEYKAVGGFAHDVQKAEGQLYVGPDWYTKMNIGVSVRK